MRKTEFPTSDILGPKPAIDTPELLSKQIGSLTLQQLRKFCWALQDEAFIQACIRGEKGPEIRGSRIIALLKMNRDAFTCRYPETVDENGKLKTGIGGYWEASRDAEFEFQRLFDQKMKFNPEQLEPLPTDNQELYV